MERRKKIYALLHDDEIIPEGPEPLILCHSYMMNKDTPEPLFYDLILSIPCCRRFLQRGKPVLITILRKPISLNKPC